MIYLGIDPGLDGALAAIYEDGRVEIFDTPTVTVKVTKGNKREYDLSTLTGWLRAWNLGPHVLRAAIEKVHAMPGQGVTSMFSMGYGLGWEWALAALCIPFQRVAPQTWQKVMLADEGKGKDAARLQAQRLFPGYATLFARKKDDGRADAVLIAEYGRRTS